jgi:WD40 repeat protein
MLAFAVARLWEKRDREHRLLTRKAYADIGKVGGALAKHAEATLTALGDEKLPIVRELFRNLVTAEGTRAVREWDELLSVFSNSRGELPEKVLRQLIDARLLASYEIRLADDAPMRRVEVVHETLLTSWPRLVRWQTQDADAAQLRDQLRQAARTWNEHDRTADYLWSGKAYREFAVWRESYPGGLTGLEEEFTSAMTAHARRRTRRRRAVVVAAFLFLLAGLVVVGTFWRRSVAETRRAEAQKLLALAQVELGTSPTEALVYTTASLELTDSEQARRIALEALAAGPPATVLPVGPPVDEGDYAHDITFSPDGNWAALVGYDAIRVVSSDGAVNRSLEPLPDKEAFAILGTFDCQDGRLLGWRWSGEMRIWSVPGLQLLTRRTLRETANLPVLVRGDLYVVEPLEGDEGIVVERHTAQGDIRVVGRMHSVESGPVGENFLYAIDRHGQWLAFASGGEVFVRSLQDWSFPPHRIGSHKAPVVNVGFAGDQVSAELESGELWLWSVDTENEPLGPFPIRERGRYFVGDGGDRLVVYRSQSDFTVEVWDLSTAQGSTAPRYRFPASVSAGGASSFFNGAAFVPDRGCLATAHVSAVALWPLNSREPLTLAEDVPTGTGLGVRDLEFTPDGRNLLALVQVGGFGERAEIWCWDLADGGPSRTLAHVSWIQFPQLAIDPRGRFAAVTGWDAIELVPLAGGSVRRLEGFTAGTWILDLAFDFEGKRVAAAGWRGQAEDKVIRIWDLETGEVTVLGPIQGAGDGFDGSTAGVEFLKNGSLVSSGDGGLRQWNVEDGSCEFLRHEDGFRLAVVGRRVVNVEAMDEAGTKVILRVTDLDEKSTRVLPSRVTNPNVVAPDPMGRFVASATFDGDGAVQVGSIDGGEPHLLLGHQRGIRQAAVSPDGLWIASAGQEGTIRLWPMPDLSKPPLHTLPREELIAKLKSLTNLRAVRDPESPTGWKIEVGPFPGWDDLPAW